MSVNRFLPHVLVLPEDDANRFLANGFQLEITGLPQRQMQVLPAAGGWGAVRDTFASDHVADMTGNHHRFMVLLVDFDDDSTRLETMQKSIPAQLAARVFVIGARGNPEELKAALKEPLEDIGMRLARECRDDSDETWSHEQLGHNKAELDRLRADVRSLLFP